ncbi:YitT family protein [Listeria welshimeri]|uniref:YitT family protein n=1 Tax=Listeria welshimeri TaxID=1643 RepID=UPI0018879060|nr:YitT family protein [Listeria welshimeri]MBF2412956.1 YitT family protein [Listeria welshimeri]MBF2467925.1 YitT family protein [Listeria welshimeri]MBF2561045.1 YitT family protein [Listeria welshimeri]MBF2621739.1 YitT family protein [Listeria welshimeri]MBF2686648.1 YitT family protein [Listeria welshimeri]
MLKTLRTKNICFIMLGTAIYAFGLVNFNIANNLGEGGLAGVTLFLLHFFQIDPAYSNLILNIPLFIIGWRILGNRSLIYTGIGTVSLSLFLWIFQRIPYTLDLHSDLLLVALFAGGFSGIGLGLVFRYGGTTGGSDIIAKLLHHTKGISMGRTLFAIDAIVLVASLSYLDVRQVMYTLVAVFIGSRVIDFVQEGAYAARGALIISKDNDAIASHVMLSMNRGVTVLEGRGGFSKNEQDVLYIVVAKNEIIQLKNIVQAVDPHAFVSVSVVHDVMGEGFTLDEDKNPIY